MAHILILGGGAAGLAAGLAAAQSAPHAQVVVLERNPKPVRRIDELGRVVIPKEIRRTQRIRRGDPLEIFTTGDGEVIFKKYSPIGEMNAVAAQYTEVLSKSFALTTFVADRDRILTP